jgi:hypothetical protein
MKYKKVKRTYNLRADILEKIEAIAWFERKPISTVINECMAQEIRITDPNKLTEALKLYKEEKEDK